MAAAAAVRFLDCRWAARVSHFFVPPRLGDRLIPAPRRGLPASEGMVYDATFFVVVDARNILLASRELGETFRKDLWFWTPNALDPSGPGAAKGHISQNRLGRRTGEARGSKRSKYVDLAIRLQGRQRRRFGSAHLASIRHLRLWQHLFDGPDEEGALLHWVDGLEVLRGVP